MNTFEQGFRIEKLIIKSEIFADIKFDFSIDNLDNNINEMNVIIGENGAGKSIFLRTIIEIFTELEKIKQEYSNEIIPKEIIIEEGYSISTASKIKIKNKIFYELTYKVNEDNYFIKKDNKFILKKNGVSISFNSLKLPNRILACSFMVNDKFLWKDTDSYRYLGVKATGYSTNVTSIGTKVINNIISNSNNTHFKEGICKVLNFLNIDPVIKVSYELKKIKSFFIHELSEDEFIDKIEDGWKKRKVAAFGFNTLENLKNNKEELMKVIYFINKYIIPYKKGKTVSFCLDLKGESLLDEILKFKDEINILIKLDLMTAGRLVLDNSQSFEYNEASSGEMHLIFIMTNILATLKSNSLILIDEPEISLHPSWIIKFTKLLNIVMGRKKGCQAIVATHSHFIISDLDPINSTLTVLKKNNKNILAEKIEYSTYGWSAENILYKIFNVPSSRNYYLSKDLEEILKKIMTNKKSDIKVDFEKMSKLYKNLSDVDPLKEVLKEILKEVRENA